MRRLLSVTLCVFLAACETAPAEPTGQQLTAEFASACERNGFMAPTMAEAQADRFWAPVTERAGIESKTAAFDRCMAKQWDYYSAARAADQNRRAALAGALLQSGAFRFQPTPTDAFQRPIAPAPSPASAIRPPINCTTTAGPNTGPFGVVTANTTCR